MKFADIQFVERMHEKLSPEDTAVIMRVIRERDALVKQVDEMSDQKSELPKLYEPLKIVSDRR